jgi:uncharacterized SAM-binding protein YcdF (DUF218 family)
MTEAGIPPSAKAKCAVVVLGALVEHDGTPSATVQRRVERAVALFHGGSGDFLVPTGGVRGGRPAEAEVMAVLAAGMGVPGHKILIESRARNTRENARYSLDLLGSLNVGRVIVVSDAWHLPRALMLFRRAAGALAVEGRAAGVRAGHLGWWMAAVREVPAFAVDVFRGRGRRP